MAFFTPRRVSCDSFPPPPESVRVGGQTDGRTLTSQPKLLGSIDYQISLAMVLRWRASARAPLLIIIHEKYGIINIISQLEFH